MIIWSFEFLCLLNVALALRLVLTATGQINGLPRKLRPLFVAWALIHADLLLILLSPRIALFYLLFGWFALLQFAAILPALRPFWPSLKWYRVTLALGWSFAAILAVLHAFVGLFQLVAAPGHGGVAVMLTRPGMWFLLACYFPLVLIFAFWHGWVAYLQNHARIGPRQIKFLMALLLVVFFVAITHSLLVGRVAVWDWLLADFLSAATLLRLPGALQAKRLHERADVDWRRSLWSAMLIFVGVFFILLAFSAKFFSTDRLFWQRFAWGVGMGGGTLLALLLIARRHLRRLWLRFLEKFFIHPRYDFRRELMRITRALDRAIDEKSCTYSILKTLSQIFDAGVAAFAIKEEHNQLLRLYRFVYPDSFNACKTIPSAAILCGTLPRGVFSVHLMKRQFDSVPSSAKWPAEFGEFEVAVAVEAGKETLGLLLLGPKRDGFEYDYEDSQLLEVLTHAIAIALHRLRLSERLVFLRQREATSRVAEYIVHDLRNSTSVLKLLVQNAERHFHKKQFQKDFLQGVRRVAEELEQLTLQVNQLRDGNFRMRKTRIDLRTLLEEVLFAHSNDSGIELRFDCAEELWLEADAHQLRILFRNLVTNAVEAMPDGGHLQIQAKKVGGTIQIQVEDSGVGMSERFVQEELFQPYKTTKATGLGLGMFQAKEIVTAHGGQIEVASQPGRGTCFTVRFPAATMEESPAATASAALASS